MSYKDRQLDVATVKQISNFLFQDPHKDSANYLDIRTDISGREMFTALLFYRILGESFNCKGAMIIGDIIERLSISRKRLGREEGVRILEQGLPKGAKVFVGSDTIQRQGTGEGVES